MLALLPFVISQTWPDLYSFAFTALPSSAETDKVLSGLGSTVCAGTINDAEKLANLGIATMMQNVDTGGCYAQTGYASSGYRVEKGTVMGGPSGAWINYEAYRVHPATTAPTSFRASGTSLFFKFSNEGEFNVYLLSGSTISRVGDAVAVTSTTEFVGTTIDISHSATSAVYFVAPSSKRISAWPLDGAVERATVFKGAQLTLLAERFDVAGSGGTPFDAALGWKYGINSHAHKYGTYKRLFRVINANAGEGVVWQDPTTFTIYVTWFDGGGTITLTNTGTSRLNAVASDGGVAGEFVYIVTGLGGNADKVTPTTCDGFKVSSSGAVLVQKAFDTSKTHPGFNLFSFFKSGAALTWNVETDELALLISRTMTRGGDGLNHQGCIGVVMNALTLAVTKNVGQMSGHSFANFVTVAKKKAITPSDEAVGEFIAVDLGDNYPRGINVHRFTATKRVSKVVYAFKTKHAHCTITAQTTTCPATGGQGGTHPLYPEISSPLPRTALGATTFYKQVRAQSKMRG